MKVEREEKEEAREREGWRELINYSIIILTKTSVFSKFGMEQEPPNFHWWFSLRKLTAYIV